MCKYIFAEMRAQGCFSSEPAFVFMLKKIKLKLLSKNNRNYDDKTCFLAELIHWRAVLP